MGPPPRRLNKVFPANICPGWLRDPIVSHKIVHSPEVRVGSRLNPQPASLTAKLATGYPHNYNLEVVCPVVLATGSHTKVILLSVNTLLNYQLAYRQLIHRYVFPVVWQPAPDITPRCIGNRIACSEIRHSVNTLLCDNQMAYRYVTPLICFPRCVATGMG